MAKVTLTPEQEKRQQALAALNVERILSEAEYIELMQLSNGLDEDTARELYRSAYAPRRNAISATKAAA